MRHITIAGSLNEYDVEDDFFVIDEQGIKLYVFTVLHEEPEGNELVTKKYNLTTPVEAVLENVCDHQQGFVDMLKMQSRMAADQVVADAKAQRELTGEHYYG